MDNTQVIGATITATISFARSPLAVHELQWSAHVDLQQWPSLAPAATAACIDLSREPVPPSTTAKVVRDPEFTPAVVGSLLVLAGRWVDSGSHDVVGQHDATRDWRYVLLVHVTVVRPTEIGELVEQSAVVRVGFNDGVTGADAAGLRELLMAVGDATGTAEAIRQPLAVFR